MPLDDTRFSAFGNRGRDVSDEIDRPTVVQLPERNATQAAGDKIRRELDAMIEATRLIAKYRRAAYEAYLAEGFTAEQALQLCTK